tara:strand:- start:177 stop:470 length:294 start_codon:yes stop_codon:yes gene_type:complete
MKRYARTRQKIDKSGVRAYTTTYYPRIPIADGDIFVYSVDGQRLDNLAYNYYGDSSYWWIIAKANGIRGKLGLKAGTPLRIPSDITGILQKFNALNG